MKRDAQLLTLAQSQADAVARVRAAKRARRTAEHRRRLEQTSEPSPAAWLAAIDRDDRSERELVLEEQTA